MMWLAALLGALCGLLLDALADWLPPRVVDQDDPSTGDPSSRLPGAQIHPRCGLRSVLLTFGSTALTVYLHGRYAWSLAFLAQSISCWLLLLIAVIDLEHSLVPNVLVLAGLAQALAFDLILPRSNLKGALLGASFGGGVFLILAIVGRGALGPGDVKLAVLIGMLTGFPWVVQALTLGILIGGLAAAILLVTRVRGPKQYIPYAPYLVAGCLSTLLFGQRIAEWFGRFSGVGG